MTVTEWIKLDQLYLMYCRIIMTMPKIISNVIIYLKYFPAGPTFILEYNLPNPGKITTIPIN